MIEARLKMIKEYENFWIDYTVAQKISDFDLSIKVVRKIKDKEIEMLNDNFTEDDLDDIVLALIERTKENEW